MIKKAFKIKFIRYAIWWWTAAILDLVLLAFFTEICHIYYIYSSVLSFSLAFSFWYFYQKYITFQNFSKKHLQQSFVFLSIQILWLWINIVLLYLLSNKLWFYYFYVAIFNKFIIFIWNYTMNYLYNFK